MQLTPAQAQVARKWIEDGAKLSDFQRKLETEFGIKLTYMEVRILVDDLKVVPKDPDPPKAPEPAPAPAAAPAPDAAAAIVDPSAAPAAPAGAQVKVVVDSITRPGAIASGSVTFTDGQTAQWYLDQSGRFGMVPPTKGYRPSEADLQQFQVTLDRELQKLGI